MECAAIFLPRRTRSNRR